MKALRKGLFAIIVALGAAFVALWVYTRYIEAPQVVQVEEKPIMQYAKMSSLPAGDLPDLTFAAENSVHAVVHINVTQRGQYYSSNPLLDWFFGEHKYYQSPPPQVRKGSGSGVIISSDGYIVTNNHVIQDADEIKVILNDKREYMAELVGTDSSSDIALLKIEEEKLPYLGYGSSDELKLGEWVLAVGNPFNLTSTVTAGIVSAKSRNIGINSNGRDKVGIEAFIQTDAAVNPGNSGGALVNMKGELVGINTAIASMTGSYSGYSFAVPVSIVKKVVDDLMEYGEVQRALLGVVIADVNAELADKHGIDKIEGVFVHDLMEGGSAEETGIEANDVILSVDGVKTNSVAELQEQISKHRPADVVKIEIKRGNKRKQFNVTLRNKHGNTEIIRRGADKDLILGSEVAKVSDEVKRSLGIENGVQVVDVDNGEFKDAGIKRGFIITQMNKKAVYEVNDLRRIINNSQGGILVEGIYPNGEVSYYVFAVN